MKNLSTVLVLIFVLALTPQASAQEQEFKVKELTRTPFVGQSLEFAIISYHCEKPFIGLATQQGKELLAPIYYNLKQVTIQHEEFYLVIDSADAFLLDMDGNRLDIPAQVPVLPVSDDLQANSYNYPYYGFQEGGAGDFYYSQLWEYPDGALADRYLKELANLRSKKVLVFDKPLKAWNRHFKSGRLWVETEAYNYVFDSTFQLLYQTDQKIIDVFEHHLSVMDPELYDERLWHSFLRSEHPHHRAFLIGYDTRPNKALIDFDGNPILPPEYEAFSVFYEESGEPVIWAKKGEGHWVMDKQGNTKAGPFILGNAPRPEAYMDFIKRKKKYKPEYLFTDYKYKEIRCLSSLDHPLSGSLVFQDPESGKLGFVSKHGEVQLDPTYDSFYHFRYPYRKMPANYGVSEVTYTGYYHSPWLFTPLPDIPIKVVIGDTLFGVWSGTTPNPPMYRAMDIEQLKSKGGGLYALGRYPKVFIDQQGRPFKNKPEAGMTLLNDSLIKLHWEDREEIYLHVDTGWAMLVEADQLSYLTSRIQIRQLRPGRHVFQSGINRILVEDSGRVKLFDIPTKNYVNPAFPIHRIPGDLDVVYAIELVQNAGFYGYNVAAKMLVDSGFTILKNQVRSVMALKHGYLIQTWGDTGPKLYDADFNLRTDVPQLFGRRSGNLIVVYKDSYSGVFDLSTEKVVVAANRSEAIHFYSNKYFGQANILYDDQGTRIMQGVQDAKVYGTGLLIQKAGRWGYYQDGVFRIPVSYTNIRDQGSFLALENQDSIEVYSYPEKRITTSGEELIPIQFGHRTYIKNYLLGRDSLYRVLDYKGVPRCGWLTEDTLINNSAWLQIVMEEYRRPQNLPEISYIAKSHFFANYLFRGSMISSGFQKGKESLVSFTDVKKHGRRLYETQRIWEGGMQIIKLDDVLKVDTNLQQQLITRLQAHTRRNGRQEMVCFPKEQMDLILNSFSVNEKGLYFHYDDSDRWSANQLSVRLQVDFADLQEWIRDDSIIWQFLDRSKSLHSNH
ncbi:WG repeat-containing protein [bacterium SCSIO 12741]|nr:WG repeat-containing protein [bacterium SCSIO 12741]